MPIFHDHYDSPPPKPSSAAQSELQRPEGSGNAFADFSNPASHSDNEIASIFKSDVNMPAWNDQRPPMLNRVELIERIKRSNSPSWSPHRSHGKHLEASSESAGKPRERSTTPLLPAAEFRESRSNTPDPLRDNASAGIEIERPRSALHSGDFREQKDDTKFESRSASTALSTSPVAPWHHSFPARAFAPSRNESQISFPGGQYQDSRPTIRSRAASQSSFSSSFFLMPPTSPLVQQSNNPDLDSRPASRQTSRSPERSNRRHTFSPHSFQTFQSHQMERTASGTPGARHLRREGTFPYQAHQPRRSLTSLNQLQPHSTPQTPLVRPRRPSLSSESPLHHAPMVGSYEESILRGRMSTTPSRPLNFVAQIGVLGKGQCKSALRCPPHVTVPFPAVFYSYNSGNGRIAEDSPSPYVGHIDIENSITPPEESREASRRRRRHTVPNPDQDELEYRSSPREERLENKAKGDLRKREKMKRRSTSPKAPQGGCYRIPQQGQLQIVIKNPNKTAVKLFLVPYNLSDMEPGQKTFIRQRSYSAGPIIDMPLSIRKNLGTDRPEAALSNSEDPSDRPVLRYLIHLHICCPSKGRYFLYKGIRVVFANRVPDGKEKLRNEIQLPEPRYSAYKPGRDSLTQQSTSSAAAQLTAEKAFRRRSAGFSLSHHQYDRLDGLSSQPPLPSPMYNFSGMATGSTNGFDTPIPVEPIPFSLTRLAAIESRPVSRDPMDVDDESPYRQRFHRGSSPSPSSELSSPNGTAKETYDKLSKGDVGYGGNAFCGVGGPAASPGAGLLAQRLRGLDVQKDAQHGEEEEDM